MQIRWYIHTSLIQFLISSQKYLSWQARLRKPLVDKHCATPLPCVTMMIGKPYLRHNSVTIRTECERRTKRETASWKMNVHSLLFTCDINATGVVNGQR